MLQKQLKKRASAEISASINAVRRARQLLSQPYSTDRIRSHLTRKMKLSSSLTLFFTALPAVSAIAILPARKSESLPFLEAPKHLEGVPGDAGFDPLGLGRASPAALKRAPAWLPFTVESSSHQIPIWAPLAARRSRSRGCALARLTSDARRRRD